MVGNFAQTNYGAAKVGLIGYGKAIGQEGAKSNIKCNILCPAAASCMTKDLMPGGMLEKIRLEAVSPIVAYLCSEEIEVTGGVFEAGGGTFVQSIGRINALFARVQRKFSANGSPSSRSIALNRA